MDRLQRTSSHQNFGGDIRDSSIVLLWSSETCGVQINDECQVAWAILSKGGALDIPFLAPSAACAALHRSSLWRR
jgi:hypothetical protein